MLVLTALAAWLALAVLTCAAWSRFCRAERVREAGYVPWLDRDEEFWTDDGELDGFTYDIGRGQA